MKILLIRDYSGLYAYLKSGLKKIGCDVTLASDGDGWKKIPNTDIQLYCTDNTTLFQKIKNLLIFPILTKRNFYGFDIVQIINPRIYNSLINYFLLKKIRNHSKKLYMSAAGDDYATYQAWKNNTFRYFVFDDPEARPKRYTQQSLLNKWGLYGEKKIVDFVDAIIPNSYEYATAYRNNVKRTKTIPFPINVDEIEYLENIPRDKIIFFHGINREAAKGTKYIREAMNIIQKRYPNKVECIINGRMPFNEYTKLMSKTNVVIDQCRGYGYGMNACIAMAQGKVVMSGAEPETITELNLESCPVINILPDVDDIVSKMEWIIQHKEDIPKIGLESRKHIEKYHHYVKVAQQYLDIWMENNKDEENKSH